MIAIAIDDEPIALDIIKSHASKVPFITLQETFTDAFAAITYLQQHKIDLIFLDIKMPDISGIDFLKSLSKPPMVVFTTAYTEHAVQSFELDAVDYLLKPFSLSRFLKACNKAHELFNLRSDKQEAKTNHIFIKDGYEQVKVELDEILYFEASGNYTQIQLKNKLLSSRITINDLADLLPKTDFIRCHRAFIVAKNKISRFDRSQIWIDEKVIPIGATYSGIQLT
ncbi:response regulator transcription factor [Pedobacter sp. HDW13]|uniref:LytR/AlgR family response regulator transcription factor n=1 Tax=unclassified Pedobacter TaxID=2628915 RepID=UPI000F5AA3DC|nr:MULTISPECIES: LytTR family DNA-binding domain-containing protein [unclassified Pedobacter]QIL38853.1 response regulator transcription factor [Pedobacter sp. HDW13]RQO67243.1 DNA-binding response regulator [Pedobacter sp. KBW01]